MILGMGGGAPSKDFRGVILVEEDSLNIGRFFEVIGLDILVKVVREEAFV